VPVPIDVKTYDSPGWWLLRCQRKLIDRQQRLDGLFARYEGNAPLPASLADAPETAKKFHKTARTNLAEMVVKAVTYKTKPVSIQTSQNDGETGDEKAWAEWRKAGMLVEGPSIVRNMVVAGDGYSIAAMHDGKPAATSEDPRQVVTIHDPVRQSVIRASGKFFVDDDLAEAYAYLYRPGRVWVAVKRGTPGARRAPRSRFDGSWDWSEDHGGEEGQALPAGFENTMVVTRYRNDEGVGDFERHVDLLDRVDHLVLQAMVVATLQAFKQRAIQVDPKDMPDRDPVTNEEISYDDVFLSAPDALWKLPATAKMWESGAVDTTPIMTMVSKQVELVSAVMFTPLSMFTPEGANQSAQGATLVREGSTFKVEDKHERIGAAHAQTAALIFRLAGLTEIADPDTISITFAPAERYSLSEKADAAVKAKASGVPWETIMREIWQFSPEQIARMKTQRMTDEVLFPAEAGQTTPEDVTPAPVA
jgi:hypothetical protein